MIQLTIDGNYITATLRSRVIRDGDQFRQEILDRYGLVVRHTQWIRYAQCTVIHTADGDVTLCPALQWTEIGYRGEGV